jgi:hypothetical protein
MVGVLTALGTALATVTELIHGHLFPVAIFGAAAAAGLASSLALAGKKWSRSYRELR